MWDPFYVWPKITRKNEHQFLGRMLQRQKRQKSTSFIVKSPFKTIAEHRKVRELPRKMNMEEVEDPKEYENLQTKPVLDTFKSTAPHRNVRELPRKMNIEEVEEPETTKIYRQKPLPSVWATRKLWKFTDETNMQARNHENSDEFRPTPLRHLDLDTPAFYYYRKNPKCYHTVWGTTVPSPSWLIWKHPIAWTIDQKLIKKCAKIGIFISGMSMSFLSKKVLHQSWHWNFKGVGGIRVHHDCRKRDWRAISSHVELEWLNEATALWLIFSLQNEETAKQETPLSCWWGILANRVLFHVVS